MTIEFVNEGRFFVTEFEGEKQYFRRPTLKMKKDLLEMFRGTKDRATTIEDLLQFAVDVYFQTACNEKAEPKYKKVEDVWDCHIANEICDDVFTHYSSMVGIELKGKSDEDRANKTKKKAAARKKRSSRTTKKDS